MNFGYRGFIPKRQRYFSALKNGPRKVKIRPEHHLRGLLKDLKAQVVRINSLDRATLGVGVQLRHLEHFFPVLQILAHMYFATTNSPLKFWLKLELYRF